LGLSSSRPSIRLIVSGQARTSIRMFTVPGERNPTLNNLTFNSSKKESYIMDDEIDPGKIAETAIGVFIGLMAFKIVKIIIKGLCE
jgi:hypothetical protein